MGRALAVSTRGRREHAYKDFQDIVTTGISDKRLAWKGIGVTEKLSASS